MEQGGILITGASSGIGRALAERMARPGATLGLVARRLERLEQLAVELRHRGADVLLYQADVSDREEMARVAKSFEESAGGVGLAIANAGIGGADRLSRGEPGPMAEMVNVNLLGVLNTLVPLVPAMIGRRSGHLVVIGSVAGFRGMPGRATYAATKAAVKTLMDGFRLDLRRHGIRVTTICPGWVESELTAGNKFPMPFFMKADKAARLIENAINRGKKSYVFPWQWRILLPLVVRLPDWMIPQFR